MFFGEIYDSIHGRIDCRQKIKPESDRLLAKINHAAVGGPLERPSPLAVEGEEEIIRELRREGGRPILVVGEILRELE